MPSIELHRGFTKVFLLTLEKPAYVSRPLSPLTMQVALMPLGLVSKQADYLYYTSNQAAVLSKSSCNFHDG